MLLIKAVNRCQFRYVSYMPRKKTFYQILEVKSDVSDEELRKAFIKRSNELHPDGKDFKDSKKNTEKFMELKEAYDALKKPERRKEYDRELEFGRAAAREMFYEPTDDQHQSDHPNIIDLNIQSPRSRLRPAVQKMSLAARVGHFFDPAKAIAFEEIERRRVIIFFCFCAFLVLSDIAYVHYLDYNKSKVV